MKILPKKDYTWSIDYKVVDYTKGSAKEVPEKIAEKMIKKGYCKRVPSDYEDSNPKGESWKISEEKRIAEEKAVRDEFNREKEEKAKAKADEEKAKADEEKAKDKGGK